MSYHLSVLQTEHPLLWDEEQLSWLNGSPMSKKLAQRAKQVQHDVHALTEAGANDIRWEPDIKEPLVSEYSARWAAATLLSRAFNLDIPSQNLNGMSMQQDVQAHHVQYSSLVAQAANALPNKVFCLHLSFVGTETWWDNFTSNGGL